MTPHIEIKKAINKRLNELGYPIVQGFPRVEVHSFDTTPSGDKANIVYDVTFIVEVVDKSTSPATSLAMISNIRANLENGLTISGYNLVFLDYELLNEIEETTDTEDIIWRQIQRIRINLNKL